MCVYKTLTVLMLTKAPASIHLLTKITIFLIFLLYRRSYFNDKKLKYNMTVDSHNIPVPLLMTKCILAYLLTMIVEAIHDF